MAQTSDDIKRLEEQQAKFNAEVNKTEDLLDSIKDIIGEGLTKGLGESLKQTRALNTQFATGVDISSQLQKAQKAAAVDLEELEFKRSRNLAQLAKARKKEDIDRLLDENRILDAQIKANQAIDAHVRSLQSASEEEKRITEEKKKQNSLAEQAKKLFQEKVKPFGDLLTTAGLLKAIVDGGNQFDKTSVGIGKSIGYGASQANRMAREMQFTSVFSGATNLTLKSATEAMGELNAATGFVAEYSKDALETQVMLTKQLGLTGEEAAGIYKLSVLTGKSSEKVNDEMVGAFVAARNASKAGIPFKESMAAAAKVSGQLKANLQADPAGIVKAVVATAALGTTLEQTASQGEKLLDFSSSLESELKAELLTGKSLNLERARAAALAGDQVTLAEELNKNIGTYDDYTKMNVLQQKALAESVGLTADQLATQLEKQKLAQKAGKSLAQYTKDEALAAEKRKDIQQKFNDIVEKLQNLIGTIGALLAPVVQLVTFFADQTWAIYTTLGLIALSRIPAMAKGFKGILGDVKEMGTNISKLFTKGGRASIKESILGGGDKVKETADKAAGAGGKAGAGGPKAGEGIKNTLKGISAGIKSFSDVSLKDIGKLALSAVALVLLTPAIPALLLLQFVNGKMIKGALTGLGQGLAALGKALGDAGPEAWLGLAIFTGVIIGLGFALKLAAPAIEAFGKAIKFVFEGIGEIITAAANGIATIFTSLQEVDVSKLLSIGPALIGIGVGLASLGAGGVIGAIGAFLGGDPIEKLKGLAASGDGLTKTATALQAIAGALTGVSAALASIDVSKLEALDTFSTTQSSNSAASGITDFITAPIKAIGESIGGNDKGTNTGIDFTPMIVAINEVKASIDKLYNKNTSINMDGKKVGSTLVQGSYKTA
jgi:hypothetical protein